MKFLSLLKRQILTESKNFYYDNYDYYSHPKNPGSKKRILNMFKLLFYRPIFFRIILFSDLFFTKIFLRVYKIDKYIDGLEFFYQKLNDDKSRQLLLRLVTFRILGYVKVKLPLSNPEYWEGLKNLESQRKESEKISLTVFPYILNKFSLSNYQIPIEIFMNAKGLYTTFFVEQYRYSNYSEFAIQAEKDDIVLDLGSCFGDTSLYFANKVGINGKVYAFEFIHENISIIEQNLQINPKYSSIVEIVKNPVWSDSFVDVYYKSGGPASKVEFNPFHDYEGKTQTITVDDFVFSKGLNRIDFIKTDIEGAEPQALKGAVHTLKKFRPKLAISIYHCMDDFVNIIKQIDELNLGYKFYLGHSTIFASETVLFCSTE